jgi:signal peptidase I
MNRKMRIVFFFASIGFCVASFVYLLPFRAYRLNTVNMEPAICKGDIVVLDTSAYLKKMPQRWDIAAYSPSNTQTVSCSRIVGLPDEVLNFDAEGLTINGVPLQNPSMPQIEYKLPKRLSDIEIKAYKVLEIKFPYVIPPGSYFLIGDNVESSRDSRYIGAMTRSQLYGKIVKVL